jgi:hypothetical protein
MLCNQFVSLSIASIIVHVILQSLVSSYPSNAPLRRDAFRAVTPPISIPCNLTALDALVSETETGFECIQLPAIDDYCFR